jgi:hypothetical protein
VLMSTCSKPTKITYSTRSSADEGIVVIKYAQAGPTTRSSAATMIFLSV